MLLSRNERELIIKVAAAELVERETVLNWARELPAEHWGPGGVPNLNKWEYLAFEWLDTHEIRSLRFHEFISEFIRDPDLSSDILDEPLNAHLGDVEIHVPIRLPGKRLTRRRAHRIRDGLASCLVDLEAGAEFTSLTTEERAGGAAHLGTFLGHTTRCWRLRLGHLDQAVFAEGWRAAAELHSRVELWLSMDPGGRPHSLLLRTSLPVAQLRGRLAQAGEILLDPVPLPGPEAESRRVLPEALPRLLTRIHGARPFPHDAP
jgi:hypothetical protein